MKIAGQGNETLKLLLPRRERQAVLFLYLLKMAAPSHPKANTSNSSTALPSRSKEGMRRYPLYSGGRET